MPKIFRGYREGTIRHAFTGQDQYLLRRFRKAADFEARRINFSCFLYGNYKLVRSLLKNVWKHSSGIYYCTRRILWTLIHFFRRNLKLVSKLDCLRR